MLNPGVCPKPTKKDKIIVEDGYLEEFCDYCKVRTIDNRFHCFECNVCIDGHDHHCPWTSKCIGKNNVCYFYFFLCSTLISFLYCYIVSLCSLDPTLGEIL